MNVRCWLLIGPATAYQFTTFVVGSVPDAMNYKVGAVIAWHPMMADVGTATALCCVELPMVPS